MTDTMTSQNIDLSSWDTLYRRQAVRGITNNSTKTDHGLPLKRVEKLIQVVLVINK